MSLLSWSWFALESFWTYVIYVKNDGHILKAPIKLFFLCSRCVHKPAVAFGDNMWPRAVRRLPLCVMEAVLGTMARPLPARSKGPSGRAAACPERGGRSGAGI